ncbi:MAG: heavy metal-responsive transcriptional regulator [Acidobacteria bacterium]|nr:MAG: heavy metal-responsive transcriptional regulator [Acidobacteriota bacterium]
MKIGELASKAHVNIQTVRFYERQGLLQDPGRTESGYRRYAEAHLKQLRFIRQAKALGFSLEEIREILRMKGRGQCPCSKVITLAERHLHDIEEQLRTLNSFRLELAKALEQWKASGANQVSADAFCVLIERATGGLK